MKILITGYLGFIGNACTGFFSENNETSGVDLVRDEFKTNLPHSDFENTRKLISENKFDVIINCAGSSNIAKSFEDPETDFEMNTGYVQKILAAIKELSPATKFINLSSAAVYGNPNILPIHETTPASPLSPYGAHKLLSEQIITHYAEFFKLKALSVRIFSAYGPGLKRQFFYDLYTKFRSGNNLVELSGTGTESRDFIFISDIVHAVEVLIEKAAFNGEIYNLASQQESFIKPTAKLFSEICGYSGEIKFTQHQFEGYPLNWKADVAKLKALGFTPKITLEEGLKQYYNWLNNNTQP